MWDEAALILGSYLLGALPFMYILGRLNGIDLREYDDMHLALWKHVGRIQGIAGVTFDFAKGVIAVLVARAVGFEIGWVSFAGVAAVTGQMWPVFSRFDGEKGNSVGFAMSVALAWEAAIFAAIPAAIGAGVRTLPRWQKPNQSLDERLKLGGPPSLSLPLGMGVAFAVLPLAAWWTGQPWQVIVAFAGLFVLIILRRLTAGVRKDLRQIPGKRNVLLNRLLFDRSEI